MKSTTDTLTVPEAEQLGACALQHIGFTADEGSQPGSNVQAASGARG